VRGLRRFGASEVSRSGGCLDFCAGGGDDDDDGDGDPLRIEDDLIVFVLFRSGRGLIFEGAEATERRAGRESRVGLTDDRPVCPHSCSAER